MNYRITKYDPKKRNEKGHYLDNSEWTSISDVGNPKYHNVSFEEYEKTEKAYIESIRLILDEKKIKTLKIDGLELNNNSSDFQSFRKDGRLKNIEVNFNNEISNLKNGMNLNLDEIQKISQLILREIIWLNFLGSDFKITFGYDYYMYFECSELTNITIKRIQNLGLFIEN